ncbi:acetate/propionate family kinase [Lactiplantibacillus mudanjiangensis]|uniref:Acetate kinase n=1 Tax=Lactiplantibacillus mudanjiangensis TaxID=1296538 RepID=A0A660E823_9LACO|nr:acetate kinase [Lactiplantibacillus mudanjiangensis]VDG21154.1 acetate kinase [Lactobacillus sp.] [Lactiplantibacillus mudanjiangensis]VDG22909.1 acetate kinase [Lactobacillus sp.] [Lactiplantibacillus mudanjiangensis]VDG29231.1 acetate kinase [Lactobacillus sp.] [Lactiplantibacillus mudanjiangensis]
MRKTLIINAGSSSLKWQLFEMPAETVLASGLVERISMPGSIFTIKYGDHQKFETIVDNLDQAHAAQMMLDELQRLAIIKDLTEITAVAHRVVAGGETFKQAVEVTPSVLEQIRELSSFAPLHNPMEAQGIETMAQTLPNVKQYAVFDSQFFTDLPEMNAIYSLPYKLTKKYHIRRYGEHGISHGYLTGRAAELLKRPKDTVNLVTMHLGSGASLAAVKDGKAFDTSMGFTPLTGVTMGTRAGDVDPSILPFLMDQLNISDPNEIMMMLNNDSGLLGVSEISPDMREIKAQEKTNPQAQLAVDIFVNRISKYAGSYLTELHGADALIFAGGIGEHNVQLRQQIIDELQIFGVKLDADLNAAGQEGVISSADSKIKVLLIPTNEELAMVRQVAAIQ